MNVETLSGDEELLVKIAKGDQHAFSLLYEKYSHRVYVQALRLLKSEELAQELSQEIFLKLWRMGFGLLDIGNVDAYLKTMTRNRCLNELRRILRENKGNEIFLEDFQDHEPSSEEAIFLKETKAVLDKAIDLLPLQQKQVYIMCYREGLNIKR